MRLLLCLLLCALCASVAYSEDWPAWRGPRGDGSSADAAPPTKWSKTDNVAWRVDLPGKGHGSPIVVGDRIFLNTAIEAEQKRVLLCLDRKTGQTLWQQTVLVSPLERKHGLNSYASSTPYCDGQRVFVTFLDVGATGGDAPPRGKTNGLALVACYDLSGRELWRKHVGKFSSVHGWSCSPVPYDDSIIVNCDHDGDGYVVRLKRADGAEVWRIDRPNKTRSYCNPLIVDVAGFKHMVMTGSKSTASYDPDTGKPRWLLDGPTEQFAAGMVYSPATNLFFLTAGFPTHHSQAVTPDGKIVWHQKGQSLAAYVPGPVAYDKWFFLVTDENKGAGRGICYDAKTGNPLWSQELGKHHRPSALVANGNVYWLADDGTCYVVRASDKYELISANPIGEPCSGAPALSDGQLFIRSDKALWCIGK
ncbi:MAG TPA: PQQ-binding-like beta-propeller repeat protein [Tepidisphaeraceae bacterium]|nr:PQQ-binding-like beta-propeller repeat protein [Tepidisphaeraceae bacterium]